jgi:hypothetical protein
VIIKPKHIVSTSGCEELRSALGLPRQLVDLKKISGLYTG